MVSTSRDGIAVVWDTATGRLAARSRIFAELGGTATFFRPDSTTSLVTIDANSHAWEWDLQRDSGLLITRPGVNLGATVSGSAETRVLVPSAAGVMAYDQSGGADELPFGSGDTPKRAIAASCV